MAKHAAAAAEQNSTTCSWLRVSMCLLCTCSSPGAASLAVVITVFFSFGKQATFSGLISNQTANDD
jgi:hypothetical protein